MELPEIDPETVVRYLTRTELGGALWRAAAAEALNEALAARLSKLEMNERDNRPDAKSETNPANDG